MRIGRGRGLSGHLATNFHERTHLVVPKRIHLSFHDHLDLLYYLFEPISKRRELRAE